MSQFYEQPSSHPEMSEFRGGQHAPQPKKEDSIMKTVGKKYAAGAAKKAGSQTEEYVKDHHEEIAQQAGQEYDDAKARAQAEFDNAKQTWSKIFPCCG